MGEKRGRQGYEAYATSTGGKTFDGRDMPKWGELPERIQDAWHAAANAIIRSYESSLSFEDGCD